MKTASKFSAPISASISASLKQLLCFCAVLFFANSGFSYSPHSFTAPVALVYSGPGACDGTRCDEAAADVARRLGLSIRRVTPQTLAPEVFSGAVVWIQPGGDARDVARALTAGQKHLIRSFIASGGSYLGFCAGAFFSDEFVDDEHTLRGLQIIPGETFDYLRPGSPVEIMPMIWYGQRRHVYYSDGAKFRLVPGANAMPIAYYPNGEIAALLTGFGKGRVAVSGPHPEAPPSWLVPLKLHDPDGPDLDLADRMLRWLLAR